MCTQALHLLEGDFMHELEAQMVEESRGGRTARQCMPMEEAGEAQRAALQQAADLSGALSACEEQVPFALIRCFKLSLLSFSRRVRVNPAWVWG